MFVQKPPRTGKYYYVCQNHPDCTKFVKLQEINLEVDVLSAQTDSNSKLQINIQSIKIGNVWWNHEWESSLKKIALVITSFVGPGTRGKAGPIYLEKLI